jgi:hypothetical protein
VRITLNWLKKHHACSEGIDWFEAQSETDGIKLVKKLMAEKRHGWAQWLIVLIMTRPQYLDYALFAAEQVLPIYEQQYPGDDKPRLAINAARKCIANDTPANRAAARAAGAAARAARAAAWAAAGAAAWAAAWAAWDAWAAWAAGADAGAAARAAWAARDAALAAGDAAAAMHETILNHGLEVLTEKTEQEGA